MVLSGCAAAHGPPVGVSSGGSEQYSVLDASSATERPLLPGLPADFRTAWTRSATRVASEHERFVADVYERGGASFAEDLSFRDAAAGVYLLEHADGGVRFAVADPTRHAIADTLDDAGPSLAACAGCHVNGEVLPVVSGR